MSGQDCGDQLKRGDRARAVIDYKTFNKLGLKNRLEEDPLADITSTGSEEHVGEQDGGPLTGQAGSQHISQFTTPGTSPNRGGIDSPSYRSEVSFTVNTPKSPAPGGSDLSRTEQSPASGDELDREVARTVQQFLPLGDGSTPRDTTSSLFSGSGMADNNKPETTVIPETPADAESLGNSSLADELNEAAWQERQQRLKEEEEALAREARRLTEQMELEQRERKIQFMKTQIQKLTEARQLAREAGVVINPEDFRGDETALKMAELLEKLRNEEALRKQMEEETRLRQQEEKERRLQEEKERKILEKRKKEQEKEEKKRLDEERKRKEEQKKAEETNKKTSGSAPDMDTAAETVNWDRSAGLGTPAIPDDRLEKLMQWMEESKAKQEAEEQRKQQVTQMQQQLAAMAQGQNTTSCTASGVNIYANLDTIQDPGSANLAAKAQMATAAALTSKRTMEDMDPDSEGELNPFLARPKKLQSGLNVRVAHKVKVEIEWAHHNMGREFEANPVPFNQLKLGQYMLGEAEILLSCKNGAEINSRLMLMRKIGYWQYKYDWPTARNIYAAVLRCIETGKVTWESLDIREFEDMLVSVRGHADNQTQRTQRRNRDAFYCAAYQKGDCTQDSPHLARVGADGPERSVIHVCSTCLIKDGKKLNHPAGAPNCPRNKT